VLTTIHSKQLTTDACTLEIMQ